MKWLETILLLPLTWFERFVADLAIIIIIFICVKTPGTLDGFFSAVIFEMIETFLAPSSLGNVFVPTFRTDFFRHAYLMK